MDIIRAASLRSYIKLYICPQNFSPQIFLFKKKYIHILYLCVYRLYFLKSTGTILKQLLSILSIVASKRN